MTVISQSNSVFFEAIWKFKIICNKKYTAFNLTHILGKKSHLLQ
jgi:hypothetical protein